MNKLLSHFSALSLFDDIGNRYVLVYQTNIHYVPNQFPWIWLNKI